MKCNKCNEQIKDKFQIVLEGELQKGVDKKDTKRIYYEQKNVKTKHYCDKCKLK